MSRLTTPQKHDGGDPSGIVYHPDDIEDHASAVLLAKDIADYLEKEYSGWLWAIHVNSKGGTVDIRSLRLSGEWGYILKLDWVQHDPVVRRRLVLKAGGEILERFKMRPGPYRHEMHADIPRDIAGRPKPDISDKPAKIRRRERDEALTEAVRRGEVKIRVRDSQRGDGSLHRRILIASAKHHVRP